MTDRYNKHNTYRYKLQSTTKNTHKSYNQPQLCNNTVLSTLYLINKPNSTVIKQCIKTR